MITLPWTGEPGVVRARLEEKLEKEYEGHTERLAALTARTAGRHPRRLPDVEAAAAATRQAIAEVASALRRMAEGTYGRCELCTVDIPLVHLEVQPAARYCPDCRTDPGC